MAGHARYTALLDACVLYPMAMADSLMSLATTGLFAAKWSTRIEAEWIGSLEENRPDLKGKLGFRRDQMRSAVPDWEVPDEAWQPLTEGLKLPDPGDVHVLAAALAALQGMRTASSLQTSRTFRLMSLPPTESRSVSG